MTDLPNSADDGASEPLPTDGEASPGDPELAALVRPDGEASPGDPELAALVRPDGVPADGESAVTTSPEPAPTETAPTETADSLAGDSELTDTTPVVTSPATDPGVDAVPVVPLAAAVTGDEQPAKPRRRRSLRLLIGV